MTFQLSSLMMPSFKINVQGPVHEHLKTIFFYCRNAALFLKHIFGSQDLTLGARPFFTAVLFHLFTLQSYTCVVTLTDQTPKRNNWLLDVSLFVGKAQLKKD